MTSTISNVIKLNLTKITRLYIQQNRNISRKSEEFLRPEEKSKQVQYSYFKNKSNVTKQNLKCEKKTSQVLRINLNIQNVHWYFFRNSQFPTVEECPLTYEQNKVDFFRSSLPMPVESLENRSVIYLSPFLTRRSIGAIR